MELSASGFEKLEFFGKWGSCWFIQILGSIFSPLVSEQHNRGQGLHFLAGHLLI